ncbi:hypothetical protein CYMTET_18805 [Cymbomonas tetramitiformis]|uniref:Uncharacterized protein n=1 Tax=Cymbomonas tetramitiformis TaxID=36881 RepID=A0AAE0L5I7_9CHLO|nr:hypothetical protein CYMTET_18805 [Cymbomonas tetramitiformis]
MFLDYLKRQLAALTRADESAASPRGFTRRADKPGRRMEYRDCPNGGKGGVSAHSFFGEDVENSVFAARFQRAIDNNNSDEFDALCILAGGKPGIVTDVSASSFCEVDGGCLVSAIDEYTDLARGTDGDALHINMFTARNGMPLAEPLRVLYGLI